MSDVLQISRRRPRETPVEVTQVTLPHTIDLPTRYYFRLAVEEAVRAFDEIAKIDTRVGDGVLHVTFTEIDPDAGDVIAEFLNHALYNSATSVEEANR